MKQDVHDDDTFSTTESEQSTDVGNNNEYLHKYSALEILDVRINTSGEQSLERKQN